MSKWRWISSAFGAAGLLTTSLAAQPSSSVSEYEVKAAFLYNFAKFVEWPARALPAGAPFVVGVLGEDPFGAKLDAIVKDKLIGGRRIVVERFGSADHARACHILFISASEEGRIEQHLRHLSERAVLTVGDAERFTERGGIVGFTMERSRVRFEINLDAAERAQLRISAHMLRLARVIRNRSGRQEN